MWYLQQALFMIIQPKQIGFIRGQYILDNVIVVWEGMKWTWTLGLDAFLMKIDFDKSYDWFK